MTDIRMPGPPAPVSIRLSLPYYRAAYPQMQIPHFLLHILIILPLTNAYRHAILLHNLMALKILSRFAVYFRDLSVGARQGKSFSIVSYLSRISEMQRVRNPGWSRYRFRSLMELHKWSWQNAVAIRVVPWLMYVNHPAEDRF